MILSCILLAISVSIDALSLGIVYGIKKAKISKICNFIIFTIALVSTSLAMILGHYISTFFSPSFATIFGSLLLIILGTYTICKIFKEKINDFDFDNSNSIDSKESILLALTVSIDASCVGLSCGIMGINNFIYPFLAAFFHICFINIGNFIAINIIKNFKISQKHLSIISGTILIIIAIARIIAR